MENHLSSCFSPRLDDAEAVCHAKDKNKTDLDRLHPVKAGSMESKSSPLDNSILKPETRDVHTIPSIAGSTTNEKPFRFLDLPPEIRNKVYKYPCIFETPSWRDDWKVPLRELGRFGAFSDLRQAPITRVNKQIRSETLPIFYGKHEFVIKTPAFKCDFRVPSLRTRRKWNYQNPFELIWKRWDAFVPDQNSTMQANSLRFLSKLTLILGHSSWGERPLQGLKELGFVMSSRELVCRENSGKLVEAAGLDWKKCGQVKEAYIEAIGSCWLFREAHEVLRLGSLRHGELNDATGDVAALMCRIAKLCPHLTSNVFAFIDPHGEDWYILMGLLG